MPTDSRFPIRFDAWYKVLSSALGLTPLRSFVELTGDEVRVQMAWGFQTRFPRNAVASAQPVDLAPISRGVHGFAGTWLVNGSGDRILEIQLQPKQRARVLGVPVSLRKLLVSVDDPSAVAARLRPA